MTPRQPAKPSAPLTVPQWLRLAANVVNGSTVLGIAVAAASGTEISKGPRGLIIAAGYRWRLPLAGAFTLGNVVLCRCTAADLLSRQALLGHEEKHCSQYAWCLGIPFLPLYFLAAGWSLIRTGNAAAANVFERHAGLRAGGYPAPGNPARRRQPQELPLPSPGIA